MSKWEKLMERLRDLSPDFRFAELKKILEEHGYEMRAPSGGSSHYIFRKAGCAPITIPKHEPIKLVYVKIVREAVRMQEAKSYEKS